MFDITIISIGSIKEKYWQEAIDEYLKRLKPNCKLNFIEIPEESITSINDRQRIVGKEGEKILSHLPKDSQIIALDKVGVSYTSTDWANKLDEWSKFGKKLTFVIGGPMGLSSDIIRKANVSFSLSKMTFTHQLTRVILLEQIYRGISILQGKTYHY